MSRSMPKFFAGLSLLFAMLACSLPATAPSLTVDQQAATAVAATLTAQPGSESESTATVTARVTSTVTAAGSTATGAVTPTITPTYSTPMLTVLQQTNCREGPGQDYQVIFTYLADVILENALKLENRSQVLATATADSLEARAAWAEKRDPVWRDA